MPRTKTARTRPKKSIISVSVLIIIYLMLCILMAFFSRTFLSETLKSGQMPVRLTLVVFFAIPVVLVIFLGISVLDLFGDLIARRTGSKFKARLLGYFIVIVVLSAAPGGIVTGLSFNEILRYWKNLNAGAAIAAGRSFSVDNYSHHIDKFEKLIKETDFSRLTADSKNGTLSTGNGLPEGIVAVQVFKIDSDDAWKGTSFLGNEAQRLDEPPAVQQGYVSRTLPRDAGMLRYVMRLSKNSIRVISYSLGDDFDSNTTAIEDLSSRFETIDAITANIVPLIFFYYGVFFFPTLLMTLIIAISFTQRVTYPIVELTEATRRVAEGDFSIQILSRRGDELGLLIRSFNAMVQDLEKSRAALVKAEKISIWQNMAQQLAHEIKNPLTPIKLSAERVLRRWRNEPEKIGEIIENSMLAIIQETEGLSALLTEFRTISKPMEPSRAWTNLKEAVGQTIVPYQSSYPSVQFETEHIPDDAVVRIDKHRLSQVLTNLIINAIDATEGKGVIEIRADIVKKRDLRYCRLSIKDSGRGIDKQEGSLIFTPYFTTKESGTGLGLPIIERIVNDHGGTIWFNSAKGMGTTFFIDLPVDDPDGRPMDADSSAADNFGTGSV